jgi:uncharacterized protein YbaR (Trm112 family)
MNPALLSILRCPESGQALAEADPATLAAFNRRIAAGAVLNCAALPVREAAEAFLIREDGRYGYRVEHGIPLMLADEGIPLQTEP